MDILFGEVKLYLPDTRVAIRTARGLLDLMEQALPGTPTPRIEAEILEKASEIIEQALKEPEHPLAKVEHPTPKVEPPAKHNRWAGVKQLRKEDILIPKFEFDKDHKKIVGKIDVVEDPDGRVAIMYYGSTYFTTKDRVLGIPYPFPPRFFDTDRGWSSTVKQAIRQYRKYLAEQAEKDPDRIYKPLLKTDTHAVHGEDYEKVEGTLE